MYDIHLMQNDPAMTLRIVRTTRWRAGKPPVSSSLLRAEPSVWQIKAHESLICELADVFKEIHEHADRVSVSQLRLRLLSAILRHRRLSRRSEWMVCGIKESMLCPWSRPQKPALAIHGLWGVRCHVQAGCGTIRYDPYRLTDQRSLRRCPACEPLWRRLEELGCASLRELRGLHRAVEQGDFLALQAAYDWHEEYLGLSRPGLATSPEGLVGPVGIWWPAVDWQDLVQRLAIRLECAYLLEMPASLG